jgi:FkbM family methyltransferase
MHLEKNMNARVSRILTQWRRAPELFASVRETSDAVALALGYLGLRSPSYPFVVHFRTGEQLRVETHHDLVTLWIIFFRNEYRMPETCRTIVDAGANIGAFSLYCARRAPGATIHALEPFPSTRARLAQTLAQNRLTSRVKVYELALADVNSGGSTRHMANEGPSQSRGTTSEPVAGSVAVQVSTLEQFLDDAKITEADFLKMDIEGAEHEVLHAASPSVLRRFREIALEYHPNGSADALFQKLSSCGFVCEHDARAGQDSGVAHFARVAT